MPKIKVKRPIDWEFQIERYRSNVGKPTQFILKTLKDFYGELSLKGYKREMAYRQITM